MTSTGRRTPQEGTAVAVTVRTPPAATLGGLTVSVTVIAPAPGLVLLVQPTNPAVASITMPARWALRVLMPALFGARAGSDHRQPAANACEEPVGRLREEHPAPLRSPFLDPEVAPEHPQSGACQ